MKLHLHSSGIKQIVQVTKFRKQSFEVFPRENGKKCLLILSD